MSLQAIPLAAPPDTVLGALQPASATQSALLWDHAAVTSKVFAWKVIFHLSLNQYDAFSSTIYMQLPLRCLYI